MANLFEKFNKQIDVQGLKKDVQEVASNQGSGDYKEVTHGEYEVSIEKMELRESKKGDPMLSIWFKIIDGEFKNSIIFYNKVLTSVFFIHQACELMRSFETGVEVEFEDFVQFNDVINEVFEKVEDGELEFALNYSQNKKGFDEYEITDVFEA